MLFIVPGTLSSQSRNRRFQWLLADLFVKIVEGIRQQKFDQGRLIA